MYFETGSSSLILPSSINCIATTEVIALVSEDRRKMVLSVIGVPGHDVLRAESFVIDRLAALLDQDVGAGDLPRRDLVLEELGDLRKLVLIEPRSSGKIESAFGADRRRYSQHQRAAGERAQ